MVKAEVDVVDDERPSNTLELFSELPEVLQMIADLPISSVSNPEKSYEQFSELLGRYQEQPHLLDPHLERLITNLLAYVRDTNAAPNLAHAAFKYMYQLSKVRTFKVLVKFLPHEIADIDFVLRLLERVELITDSDHWESRYVLLIWLSILVLNPFQMSRLDAFADDGTSSDAAGNDVTKAERVYRVCTRNVNNNDTCATVAAFLAAKYLIRIDIKDKYLPIFFGWIIGGVNAVDTSAVRSGQLAAVSAILKHGKREDLLTHAGPLLAWILGCNYKELSDYLKSKLFIKIVQRIGLVLLKPRLANWRYQRGSRSLTANLAEGSTGIIELQHDARLTADGMDEELDAEIHVPDEIEDVVEELLQALRSPSSDIRWSAAKGIGRVTNRLPKELGDEVVGSVIDILNPLEPHEAWHGGCLAIAELSKRGLLLPYRLQAMVPILLQALIYDEMKGYMSVGQHIRDAACYMSWAFARAYEPTVLQPFIQKIAAGLIVTTVFDREINCRRAASAAFQESVGRLGNFPHGIDILTEADFYSVGMRANAYLHIADFVAQFEEYTRPLIDHLVQHKINHWDTVIREIAAKTLFNLTKRDPLYMVDTVLPILFEKTSSIDVNLRHGSVMSIGEIAGALRQFDLNGSGEKTHFTVGLYEQLNGLLLKFLQRDQFRGMSGDIMHQCCCDFIRNCSRASIPATSDCIDSWQTIIDTCIVKKSTQLRDMAIGALHELCRAYYVRCTDTANAVLVQRYLLQCQEAVDEHVRMGSVSALGAMPSIMLQPSLEPVLSMLMRHALKPDHTAGEQTHQLVWAEARRDSVKALLAVTGTQEFATIAPTSVDRVFACLLLALQEYTIDDRGDIGAWVREAAMTALHRLVTVWPAQVLRPDTVQAIMLSLAQQAVENIDRTRGLAGSLFCKLVNHEPAIPHIQRHDFLKTVFPADSSSVLWIFADHTFPMFCALLALPEYTQRLIVGLSASVGKLTESLVKYSSAALFQFLRGNAVEVPRICADILIVFEQNQHNDRITHPLLNFMDTLLSSGTIDAVLLNDESDFADQVFRLVKLEIKGQKKLYKLVSSINVFCHLIQVRRLCPKVLSTLAIFLGLTHVHVRKSTASKLYEAIVVHGESCGIPDQNIDEILELLSETDWGEPLPTIRPLRNQLCTLLGIKPPVSLPGQR